MNATVPDYMAWGRRTDVTTPEGDASAKVMSDIMVTLLEELPSTGQVEDFNHHVDAQVDRVIALCDGDMRVAIAHLLTSMAVAVHSPVMALLHDAEDGARKNHDDLEDDDLLRVVVKGSPVRISIAGKGDRAALPGLLNQVLDAVRDMATDD